MSLDFAKCPLERKITPVENYCPTSRDSLGITHVYKENRQGTLRKTIYSDWGEEPEAVKSVSNERILASRSGPLMAVLQPESIPKFKRLFLNLMQQELHSCAYKPNPPDYQRIGWEETAWVREERNSQRVGISHSFPDNLQGESVGLHA